MAAEHYRQQAPISEPLYTLDDLARRAKVSQKTLRRLIERGELRSVRVGTQIRVRDLDWQAYLARSARP